MNHSRTALLGLALTAVLLGACGDDGSSGGPPGDSTVSTAAPAPNPSTTLFDPLTASAKPVRSRTDLLDERRAKPLRVSVDPADDRLVRVRFWGGVERCHGVRVAVEETTSTVTVTLFAGTPPEGKNQACIELAELQEVTATLLTRLGSRRLVWDQ